MAFKLDGKTLPVGVAFTSNGVNYPANWLRLTTLDEKKAIGITEEADPASYDTRFYTDINTAKALADTTEKDSDGNDVVTKGLKTEWIEQQKREANGLLAEYDWQVTRKAEKGTALDSKVETYRDSIRTTCTTRETEITNCANVEALKTLIDGTFDDDGKRTAGITLWPEDPYATSI